MRKNKAVSKDNAKLSKGIVKVLKHGSFKREGKTFTEHTL